jgi:hypothetical protein
MTHPALRALITLAAGFFSLGLAHAADALPDRSSLSYEDNVSINAACFASTAQGSSYFESCVKDQIAALQGHPGPDRTAVPADRMAAAARDCDYLRRVGIAQYNDCLRQGVASGGPIGENGAVALVNKAAAMTGAPTATVIPAAATTLPPPRSVLKKEPNHIERQPLSAAEVYKKVERSVFVVIAAQSVEDLKLRNVAQGSAVAVSDHLLLTNCHVVKDRPVIHIVQDQVIAEARIVAGDFTADRCILESDGPPVTPIGGVRAFTDLAIGERVFAIGSPRALERTLSDGIISGLRHDKARGDLVQTSAPISPGSSGGGLFDDRGNLVGITSFHVNGAQNLDFAIAAAGYWE